MNNQIKIYNPASYQVFNIDFDEIRFWLDIYNLQQNITRNSKHQKEFNSLENDVKEKFLRFIDRHEKQITVPLYTWEGIKGLRLSFGLEIIYNPEAEPFVDHMNQTVKDKFFYKKDILAKEITGNVLINNREFPVETTWLMSEDFISVDYLDNDSLLPVHERFLGDGSDGNTKVLLDQEGNIAPITLVEEIYSEPQWIFNLILTVEPEVYETSTIWGNIPQIKSLNEFFQEEGFEVKGDGIRNIIWERDGDKVEFYLTPVHCYKPFIYVKAVKHKLDVRACEKLGEELLDKLEEQGILEEIQFYHGNERLSEAIDKLKVKNKTLADELLNLAIDRYDNCKGQLWGYAKIESIFSAWMKNRIAKQQNDTTVYRKSYQFMIEQLIELRMIREVIWLVEKIYKEDKKMAFEIVKTVLPIPELHKHFFVSPEEYKTLLKYWEIACKQEKCPTDMTKSEWLYHTAKEAYEVGLPHIAQKRFNAFCKEAEKRPDEITWASDFTENILDFAIKVGSQKRYAQFAESMAQYFRKKRLNQGIGDMSAVGRKNYRWTVLSFGILESKWAFHSGYLLSKLQKEKMEVIHMWYNKAYDAFSDSIVYYDSTENLSEEQLEILAQSFVTVYHIGFNLKDDSIVDYSLDLIRELWRYNSNKNIYTLTNSLFSKKEREEMADSLIDNWMNEVKEREGTFSLDTERVLQLTELYMSVDEWKEAVKTLSYGLDNFHWSYEELNESYKLYQSIQSIDKDTASICESGLFYWINMYIQENEDLALEIPQLISRINHISKV